MLQSAQLVNPRVISNNGRVALVQNVLISTRHCTQRIEDTLGIEDILKREDTRGIDGIQKREDTKTCLIMNTV